MLLQLVRRMALITCFVTVQACTTTPRMTPGSPHYQKQLDITLGSFQAPKRYADLTAVPATEKSGLQAALEKDFNEMMDGCQVILGTYEAQSTNLKWWSFGFAIAGAVAGTVLGPALIAAAPVANKAASSAMSGLSGLSNTAQGALIQQGLTSAQALATREGIVKALQQVATDYGNALLLPNLDERFTRMAKAISEGKAACIAYSIAYTSPSQGQQQQGQPPGGGAPSSGSSR